MERDQATTFITALLKLMAKHGGSDLFLSADLPPAIRVNGKIIKVSPQPLNDTHTFALARSIMNDRQAAEFERTKECNFAIAQPDLGRFRVNVFSQQGKVGLVLRTTASKLPTIDSMKLPLILKDIVNAKRGLCIVVGATGSGKTTTLAAMVDHRNESSFGHIITVEDPIEFVHTHKNCVVTQREVGIDTDSWGDALENVLHQAPDVIMMGEIRDHKAMDMAINFAEAGHLCLATLRANSTSQAIQRIINFFPQDQRQQLLMDLSLNLKAVVSQRLIIKPDGKDRTAVVEVMLNSPLISNLLLKGEVAEIIEIMKKSPNVGMQTFDQALFNAYEAEEITSKEALRNADSAHDLRLQIQRRAAQRRLGQ